MTDLSMRLIGAAVAAFTMCGSTAVLALENPAYALAQDPDLSQLSLEELADIQVTSVSKREEPLSQAAASIYVISADDIRRSGADSLPEVLRLAPNLSVQRVNAVDYAISARGFNGFETSNKLLVLVDGRSVYSTLSSGVFWDARDLFLDNVERIEVISGPGGALYGSNAMNGVINIITRSAADTPGLLVTGTAGNEGYTYGARVGGAIGEGGAWRAYVTGFSRDDSLRLTGGDATDAAEGARGGARVDWLVGSNALTLQGDVFDNTVAINEDFSGTDTRVRGGNVLARLSRPFAGGDLQVQAYYDRFERAEPGTLETSDTYDLALQQTFDQGPHQIVVGGGYRRVRSTFTAGSGAFLDPPRLTLSLLNLFAQDQITLRPGLTLTLGAKVEDNSFSGQQFLPSVRVGWQASDDSLIWAAVSRATRTPNRIERGLFLGGFLEPGDFQSETATAYEIGYRASPLPELSFSLSAYHTVYDDLRTVTPDPVSIFPLRFTNLGQGATSGVEAWGSYDMNARWRLKAGIATLSKRFRVDPSGSDVSGLASLGDDPDYQLMLRSQSDLTDALALDLGLRAVGPLYDSAGYVEAEGRLGWRLNDHVELSLVGQNLLGDDHVETGDPVRRRAFGRSVYAALRMSY